MQIANQHYEICEKISFQSISERSLLTRSVENCEKLRALIVFTTLPLVDVKIQECEK